MVRRRLKENGSLAPRAVVRGSSEPSPFPLLLLVLVIVAMVLLDPNKARPTRASAHPALSAGAHFEARWAR